MISGRMTAGRGCCWNGVAGVIGTALSAIRGGPSPGLRPTPPTPLRSAGGEVIKTSSPNEVGGGRASGSEIGRGMVNRGGGCYWGGVECITRRALPRPSADPSHFAALRGRGGIWEGPKWSSRTAAVTDRQSGRLHGSNTCLHLFKPGFCNAECILLPVIPIE